MDSVGILMFVSASAWHGGRMTTNGGAGHAPGGTTWAGETAVVTCVVAAVLPLGLLHVNGIGVLDPLDRTISDYAFLQGGYALLGVAAVALAVASLVLASGLRRAALPDPGPPTALMVSAAAALVLVAAFPTHDPDTTPGLVSTVHRAAGGWVFVVIPLAGWMVARRARTAVAWAAAAPTLTWCAGVAGALSTFFLMSHLPIVIGGSPGFPLLGGVQRVLYSLVMLVLVATARATRLAVERAPSPAALPSAIELRGAT
jgi:hypothetical protein